MPQNSISKSQVLYDAGDTNDTVVTRLFELIVLLDNVNEDVVVPALFEVICATVPF